MRNEFVVSLVDLRKILYTFSKHNTICTLENYKRLMFLVEKSEYCFNCTDYFLDPNRYDNEYLIKFTYNKNKSISTKCAHCNCNIIIYDKDFILKMLSASKRMLEKYGVDGWNELFPSQAIFQVLYPCVDNIISELIAAKYNQKEYFSAENLNINIDDLIQEVKNNKVNKVKKKLDETISNLNALLNNKEIILHVNNTEVKNISYEIEEPYNFYTSVHANIKTN